MISSLFNLVVYNPLYNALVGLINLIPWADAGVIIIIFTIFVRLILFPLSKASVRTQIKMKEIEPELNRLKEQYKDNKQKQAEEMMALYKKNQINPFSGFFLIFLQIPIIIALYYIFLKGGLPNFDSNLLYSFIPTPSPISMHFFGFFDIGTKSIFLAILAGISQFFQVRLSMPAIKKDTNATPSFGQDLAKSMNIQMRYVMPVVIAFVAYSVSGAVALYWITSNLFTIGQEIVVRRQHKNESSKQA